MGEGEDGRKRFVLTKLDVDETRTQTRRPLPGTSRYALTRRYVEVGQRGVLLLTLNNNSLGARKKYIEDNLPIILEQ